MRRFWIYSEERLMTGIQTTDQIKHLAHCRQIHVGTRFVWLRLKRDTNRGSVLFASILSYLIEPLNQPFESLLAVLGQNEIESLASVPKHHCRRSERDGVIDRR